MSQSLFYWIIYSYKSKTSIVSEDTTCLNPYFIGLSILIVLIFIDIIGSIFVSILILLDYLFLSAEVEAVLESPAVSILILLDYLFLLYTIINALNHFRK